MNALEVKALAGATPSVIVRGEIDLSNYSDVLQLVCGFAPADKEWLLDLSSVSYMDSSGVRVLLALRDQYEGGFHVIANEQIIRILDTLGLTNEFRWHTSGLPGTPHSGRTQ